MPQAKPAGNVICVKKARIAPRKAYWGCRLHALDNFCTMRSLLGMSFAG